MKLSLTADPAGLRFPVKVVPGASRDRLGGLIGDALKVQVACPPEKGRANTRLCEVIAEALQVPTRAVQVASGHTSARKVVLVRGLDAATLLSRLGVAHE